MRPRLLPAVLWVLSFAVLIAFIALAMHGLGAPPRDAETQVLEHAVRIERGDSSDPVVGDALAMAAIPEDVAEAPVSDATPMTTLEGEPGAPPQQDAPPADAMVPAAILPGAPAVVAVLVNAFGPYPWQPRVVALLATLATALLVALAVRAETLNDTIGVAAGGVFLAARMVVAAMPGADVVEACVLCLVVAAFVTLRFARGPFGTITAALLLAAAWFTHLMAGWFLAAALAHTVVESRRRALVLAGVLILSIAAPILWTSQSLEPPVHHAAWEAAQAAWRLQPELALDLIGGQLLGRLGVLTLVGVLTFALPMRPWRGAGGVWMWLAAAALAASLATSQSTASALAVLPALAALVLLGPISLQRVTRHLSAFPGASRLGGQEVVFAGLGLQFLAVLSALPAVLHAS